MNWSKLKKEGTGITANLVTFLFVLGAFQLTLWFLTH